jgi:hypothetical protein
VWNFLDQSANNPDSQSDLVIPFPVLAKMKVTWYLSVFHALEGLFVHPATTDCIPPPPDGSFIFIQSFCFVLFYGTEDQKQGLTHAKQVLYH